MAEIFRDLPFKLGVEVNLDSEAQKWQRNKAEYDTSCNSLLQPQVCQEFVHHLSHQKGARWSYGGYLENRSHFLRGSYLEHDGKFLHLGVDFNAPSDSVIIAPRDMKIIHLDNDNDYESGWGPVIVAQDLLVTSNYYVFAHLGERLVSCGELIEVGAELATVGTPPENGNWFPHLHVQTILESDWLRVSQNGISAIDGYGDPSMIDGLTKSYPNPLQWILGTLPNLSAR